jgi:nucleotide-binding universal stress UspA family protein
MAERNGMKTIVVGYDASDAAERALARAADIAHALSARMVVVSVTGSAHVPAPDPALERETVLVPPTAAGPVLLGETMPVPGIRSASQPPDPDDLARRQLERARTSLAGRGVEAEYVVEVGDPAERLLDVAEERDADLIAVGSRERGFLDRLLGHGVDETVARRSTRDVLLVH